MGKKIRFLFLILLIFSFSFLTRAVNITWTSAAGGNWNVGTNWSTNTVPTNTDVAVFDGTATGNCTITAAVNVGGINVGAAYTGTITQNANNITIGTSNAVFSGGTFTGGSSLITCNGTFTLSGTLFTSTTSTLAIAGTFAFTGGTFSHNNGTVSFNTNTFTVSGSPTFNNLTFVPFFNTITFSNSLTVSGNLTLNTAAAWCVLSIAAGQVLTVNGNFTMAGNSAATINTGTLAVGGNITITNSSTSAGGSGTVLINGTGAQTLTGSGTINQGCLPNVVINKTSGTLSLASYITCTGPLWSYVAGTINAGTSTVCFYNTGVAYTVSGTQTLNNVVFYGNYNTYTVSNILTTNDLTFDATLRCDMIISSSITVNGTLYYTGTGYVKLTGGTLNIKGNFNNNNTSNNANSGGTTAFTFNGTGNQTLTGPTAANLAYIPPLVINKTSGILYFVNFINLYNGITWTAGSVDPGTSTTVFSNPTAASQAVNASSAGMSFYNLIFDQPDYEWTNLSTDINVAGSMTITAGSGIKPNGHIIYLGGNFTSLNTTATGAGFVFNGNSSLTLNGTGLQTITSNNAGSSANRAIFNTLVINNTAGRPGYDDITLADILTVSGSATFTSGTMLTTATKYLVLNSGASCNTGSSNSYVNGPMVAKKASAGSTTLNFPLGCSGDWRPAVLTVNHTAATLYNYTAQLFNANPWISFGSTTTDMPAGVDTISGVHYWTIARTDNAGTSQPTASLSGNQQIQLYFGTNDFVYQGSNLTIVKNTSATPATWIDIGGSCTLGNFSTPQAGNITSTSSPSTFTSFSSFTLGSKATGWNGLPIDLLDFSATANQNKVDLKWETATETSNAYFTIEKSRDGSRFTKLIDMPGAGNSLVYKTYFETDYQPYRGISYYRLKQTDFNGNFKYFPIIPVKFEKEKGILLYPNPVNAEENLNLDVSGFQNSEVLVVVRDAAGKDLYSKVHLIKEDDQLIAIDRLNTIPAGAYFVIASSNNTIYCHKLIIK